uniref:Uncharacterized protein n=1 Tax=Arundo donax TaxID=35708 RepID=A0A0A9EG14_ARUDO
MEQFTVTCDATCP